MTRFIISVNMRIKGRLNWLGFVSADNIMDDEMIPNRMTFYTLKDAKKWLKSDEAKSWNNDKRFKYILKIERT